tara:strand:+ start:83 stop:493 length:411 start_codon:yes stop_codon:yes gene_type:complete
MNDQISWDQSLIKKYSSSNHFKLLNQLRTEVNKYPLNKKKKNKSAILNIDNNYESKNNSIITTTKDLTSFGSSYEKNKINNNSNISFNNSKNFSIYNKSNDSPNHQNEINNLTSNKTNEENSSISFKDRLNQIDMK